MAPSGLTVKYGPCVDAPDRDARDKAAELILRLATAQITNDEFDDNFPQSRDRGVNAVYIFVWHFYSDLDEHRLEGRFTLSPEARSIFDRCILFLRSDLAYRWPPLWSMRPLAWLICRMSRRYEMGERENWPFLRRADLEQALRAGK